ncbi:gluconokinase [Pediococcus acidilactici]|uniref:gluconokinase n=1 Tax=Pediococcus acidilactici TaxID=1254 RepID=UPI00097E7ACD|nr:FGGY family carbohydrate kinase [Pediococcus acidilactici]QDJ23313.1 gluconate kinase [Pediococcus acidilactici]SJM45250.1 Gluconokinase [Pediococcus acidilactici]
MKYIIGMDIGTTSTKAVLFDLKGRIVQVAHQLYPIIRENVDSAEEDPDVIYDATVAVLQQVIQTAHFDAVQDQLLAISLSAQQHSIMGVDDEFNPVTKLAIWADNRAEKYADQAKRDGSGLALYQRTGVPTHPMAPYYKLQWYKHEAPARFKQAKYWLGIKSYIIWKYFGQFLEEQPMAAATGLFNTREMQWDVAALQQLGLQASQLPQVVEATHQVHGLNPQLAKQIGIPAETPFVMGSSDGVATTIGVGAVRKGQIAIDIGTSAAVRTMVDEPQFDPKGRIYCYPVLPGKWIIGGPINNGGVVLRWARDQFFNAEKSTAELLNQDPYDLLTKIAGEAPAGSKGLLFHPFLGGERAPIWSGNARGSFFGLTQTHTRAHMLRAILEGIVYNLFTVNLALEEVMPKGDRQILATGGFAHSELWKHILADVFEEPVKVPKSVEGGCMGAMVIAQISLGLAKDLTKVEDFLVKDAVNTYEPNPTNFRAYRDLMPIYIRLSRELAGEYDSIAEYQRTH